MLQADISDRASLVSARDSVTSITGGKLDYLINNAAYIDRVTESHSLDDFADADNLDPKTLDAELLQSFRVNVVGVIDTINTFLPLIKNGNAKKVVVISTGMADHDLVNNGQIWNSAPYTISKAAVNMVVSKYNARLASQGILVFALSPGVVATYGDHEPTALQDLRKMVPGWPGPLQPLESAEMCMNVIYDFSLEKGNGGAFVSHHGNKEWL
jgi:NAD(P)-dependent dehydrogenase (short-subunit alcohol dehydrogenase family)